MLAAIEVAQKGLAESGNTIGSVTVHNDKLLVVVIIVEPKLQPNFTW
jgi:hypothetical protein